MSHPALLVVNDVETAYDHPDRVGRLAGLLAARRGDRTLLLDAGDSTALGALATEGGTAHALPFHDAGGERVSLVSLCHPETDRICAPAADLTFTDPAAAARRGAAALRDRVVDDRGPQHEYVVAHARASGLDGER